ncbi:hypothetical protein CC80DRAFT_126336 [Byssothecium circinans]|uniref:Secreted protein n=1 Tax=Byssothecium circinans TaxID=147558 RepID=A0A6A5TZQ1_9PLEO|nr:hypothetical protein CC80DRAFT_126336 [Byssothecium circinans]
MFSTLSSWCRLTIAFLLFVRQLSLVAGSVFARMASSCAICSRHPSTTGMRASLVPVSTKSVLISRLMFCSVVLRTGNSVLMWRKDFGISPAAE